MAVVDRAERVEVGVPLAVNVSFEEAMAVARRKPTAQALMEWLGRKVEAVN